MPDEQKPTVGRIVHYTPPQDCKGKTTLEQEFMAHIVLPNGQTIGDVMTPQIEASYRSQQMPPLLGLGVGQKP